VPEPVSSPEASGAPRPAPPSFLRQAWLIARKDLAIEWRSREIVVTTAFLAVVIVLIFSFAFVVAGAPPTPAVVSGILWVAVVVSGTVALSRTFERERDGDALRALLLTPVPRPAVYLGKLLAVLILMLGVETLVTVLTGVFFTRAIAGEAPRVSLLLLLGTVGFAAVGCVFSAALLRARGRETLLAALLNPIVVPIVIAGSRGTALVIDLASPDFDAANFWTQFLAVVDVLFVLAGLWSFEPVVSGD